MIRHPRRLLRLVRLLWFMLVSLAVAYPLLELRRKCGRRSFTHYQQAAARWWSRKFCQILNLRIRVAGEIGATPTLFVANHISWLDVIALRSQLDAVFVAKEEIRSWPVFGGLAVRTGTLFLRRGEQSPYIAEQMTLQLKARCNVLFFPEGTSSRGDTVDHFHARLYQSAVQTASRVQAVALRYPHRAGVNPLAPFVGDDVLLAHLWRLLGEPQLDVSLSFCAPLAAADRPRRVLAEQTRSQIRAVVQEDHRMPVNAAISPIDDGLDEVGEVAMYSSASLSAFIKLSYLAEMIDKA